MPACSTSRAVFFTGRYPFRTDVYGALGPDDLANSMVSPFETTAPKLLKMKGYQSALFGKFHLGLQANSPFRYAMPRSLCWDYFFGWLDETGRSIFDRHYRRRRRANRNIFLRLRPRCSQRRRRYGRLLCRE